MKIHIEYIVIRGNNTGRRWRLLLIGDRALSLGHPIYPTQSTQCAPYCGKKRGDKPQIYWG